MHNKNKDDNTYVGLKRRKIQLSGVTKQAFFFAKVNELNELMKDQRRI